ncbi:putative extracellular matrix protein [Erysiphe neolycopersici]|uniref:Putative extracellular matrix protein n=1 Tax=Erysiphe neolycopersici TaxID=212602 RepID=A0A420HXC1_9PEZI|nr:putative extracellular matrix protein [Erysiphe neolycopersici]
MLFSRSFAAGLLLAVTEAVHLTNTQQDYNGVTSGKPFTITWAEAAGPVTILLKSGPSTNLRTVSTIASGQTGTSYKWTPDSNLPSGVYAFEIQDSNGPNYSVQFPISGSTSSSSSSTYVPSASMTYSTGPSSYTSATYNATSALTSSMYATSSYVSVYPTSSYNYTSSTASATPTTEPITIPSDTNSASGITSPLALVMWAIAAIALLQ